MVSSQQFVIAWIEFALVGALLLATTYLIVERLRQPVDRISLIGMCFLTALFVPLLLSVTHAPAWRLGLLENKHATLTKVQPLPPPSYDPPHPDAKPETLDEEKETPISSVAERRPVVTERHEPSGDGLHPNDLGATPSVPLNPQPDTNPTRKRGNHSAVATSENPKSSNSTAPWSILALLILASHALAVFYFAFQWFTGRIHLRNIIRRAHESEEQVKEVWKQITGRRGESVRILTTTDVGTPMVFGWLHPIVLIPVSLAKGDRDALRYCLAHEWSHVASGDLFRWQLINACRYLFWYQPLYWRLRRELQICQDLIADDLASGTTDHGLGRIEYSELLMKIAQQGHREKFTGAIALFEPSSQLARRVHRLIEQGQSLRLRSTRSFYWIAGSLLLAGSFLLGSIRLGTAHADQDAAVDPVALETQATDASQTESTPPASEMRTFRGLVHDEVGDPVSDAKLWLQLDTDRVVAGTTDETGRFELKYSVDWLKQRRMGLMETVWVHAPGYYVQSRYVYSFVRDTPNEECKFHLVPETKFNLRILEPDEQPSVGLLVKPVIGPSEVQDSLSAHTDPDGYVTLSGMESFSVQFDHERLGIQTFEIDKEDPNRELKLKPVGSIRGRIISPNPEWARGLSVTVNTSSNAEPREAEPKQANQVPPVLPPAFARRSSNRVLGSAKAVTDDEGRFEVPIIAIGTVGSVDVLIDRSLPVRPRRATERFQLAAGETVEVEYSLVPAPLVRGTVVSKSTGKPLPNVEISIPRTIDQIGFNGKTDESGRYEGHCLPGQLTILTLPEGLVPLAIPHHGPFEVPAGVQEFELPIIELLEAREVRGRLVDSEDKPIPNAEVYTEYERRRYRSGRTDAEGRFQIQAPHGVATAFHVILEGKGGWPLEVVRPDPLTLRSLPEAEMVRIPRGERREPRKEFVLTGRVLNSEQPVKGVSVLLRQFPSNDSTGNSSARTANIVSRFPLIGTTQTDEHGKYRLSGLKEGDEYQIEIRTPLDVADPTWKHQAPYTQKIPDQDGKEIALPDVNLMKMNQRISGVVVSNGKPIEGAAISVLLRSGEMLSSRTQAGQTIWTETDGEGRFQLQGLPDTPLTIKAIANDPKYSGTLDVEKNQQDVRIELAP